MQKNYTKLGLVSTVLALAVIGSTSVFALPPQARAHAQTSPTTTTPSANTTSVNHGPTTAAAHTATTAQANRQAAMLRVCQNRQSAITHIMTRIDTRATNQLNLFSTIASRVEAFYTKSGKTVSDYTTLLGNINTTHAQAASDLATLKTNSTFSCTSTSTSPKGMVTAFQSYLKTAISDLKAYKTAVKNLIVAVASANGVNLSSSQTGQSSTSSSTTGTSHSTANTAKGGN